MPPAARVGAVLVRLQCRRNRGRALGGRGADPVGMRQEVTDETFGQGAVLLQYGGHDVMDVVVLLVDEEVVDDPHRGSLFILAKLDESESVKGGGNVLVVLHEMAALAEKSLSEIAPELGGVVERSQRI